MRSPDPGETPRCSDKSKLAHAQSDKKFLSGRKEFQIILHHSEEFPAGTVAPASIVLCPQAETPGEKVCNRSP